MFTQSLYAKVAAGSNEENFPDRAQCLYKIHRPGDTVATTESAALSPRYIITQTYKNSIIIEFI
jgi:hypothetical protein